MTELILLSMAICYVAGIYVGKNWKEWTHE